MVQHGTPQMLNSRECGRTAPPIAAESHVAFAWQRVESKRVEDM